MGRPKLGAMDDLGDALGPDGRSKKIKIVVYGEEVIEKTVTLSGGCGRVYLPREWLGKSVKIILL